MAVVNVALNLLLIPHLGILGSALATLISAAILFFAYMRASRKFYPIPYRWGVILPACIAVALVMLAAYFIPTELNVAYFPMVVGKLLLFVAASIWIIRSLLVRN